MPKMLTILSVVLLGVASSGFLFAIPPAPEIGPASAPSALALLAGILAVIVDRRKRSGPRT